MRRKHYFIAIGLAGSTILLYAVTEIWRTPIWVKVAAAIVSVLFLVLTYSNPVDPAHRRQTSEPAPGLGVRGRIARRRDVTALPENPIDHPLDERTAYSLWGPLSIVGIALFLGIPVSVAAGYQYADATDMDWVDVAQYGWTFGLLFTIPMLVMFSLIFIKDVSGKVTGVLGVAIWGVLYWIGYSFHENLGVVTGVGRGVAQWWAG